MRRCLVVILVSVALGSFTSGCVHTSVYRGWGNQLTDLPNRNGRVDDVSLILGTAPTRCEPIASPSPTIGFRFNPEEPVVLSVRPNSPADRAGLRTGDTIKRVNGQPVADGKLIGLVLQGNLREGQAVQFETNRGVLSVVPMVPRAEQCYWEVQAGQVARAGGAAFVNQYGGSAYSGGSANQRFFRASCRLYDGFVVACQSNWQE
jgi:membrane-associated protease RseP (regulator of RpoE activity)